MHYFHIAYFTFIYNIVIFFDGELTSYNIVLLKMKMGYFGT